MADNQAIPEVYIIRIPHVVHTSSTATTGPAALAQAIYQAFSTRDAFMYNGRRYEGEIGVKSLINDILQSPAYFEMVQGPLPGSASHPLEIPLSPETIRTGPSSLPTVTTPPQAPQPLTTPPHISQPDQPSLERLEAPTRAPGPTPAVKPQSLTAPAFLDIDQILKHAMLAVTAENVEQTVKDLTFKHTLSDEEVDILASAFYTFLSKSDSPSLVNFDKSGSNSALEASKEALRLVENTAETSDDFIKSDKFNTLNSWTTSERRNISGYFIDKHAVKLHKDALNVFLYKLFSSLQFEIDLAINGQVNGAQLNLPDGRKWIVQLDDVVANAELVAHFMLGDKDEIDAKLLDTFDIPIFADDAKHPEQLQRLIGSRMEEASGILLNISSISTEDIPADISEQPTLVPSRPAKPEELSDSGIEDITVMDKKHKDRAMDNLLDQWQEADPQTKKLLEEKIRELRASMGWDKMYVTASKHLLDEAVEGFFEVGIPASELTGKLSGLEKHEILMVLASKVAESELEKKAGIWSLPDTQEKAQALASLLNELESNPEMTYGVKYIEEKLSPLFGDDTLFDVLDRFADGPMYGLVASGAIRVHLGWMLKYYQEQPESFNRSFEQGALNILTDLAEFAIKKTEADVDSQCDLGAHEKCEDSSCECHCHRKQSEEYYSDYDKDDPLHQERDYPKEASEKPKWLYEHKKEQEIEKDPKHDAYVMKDKSPEPKEATINEHLLEDLIRFEEMEDTTEDLEAYIQELQKEDLKELNKESSEPTDSGVPSKPYTDDTPMEKES